MTKTEFAERYIRNKILIDVWKEGDVLPNTIDLAKEIGVSKFTLAEAMKPLVDEGIIARKTKLGSVVQKKCEEKQGTILTIGSMKHVNDYGGYLEQTLISKSQELLLSKGHEFKIATGVGDNLDSFIDSMHIFDENILNNTIGVMNLLGYFPLTEFERHNISNVSLSAFYTGMRSEVDVDLYTIFKNAVDILLSHKFKKAAIFNIDFMKHSMGEGNYSIKKDTTVRDFLKNVQDTYSNIDVINIDVSSAVFGYVYDVFKDYIQNNPNLEVIFIGDDGMIPEIYRVIEDLNISIPGDLKILAWTNKGRNYGFPMTWTRFEQDIEGIIDCMYDLLMKQIDGDTEINKMPFLPMFINGDSL